MGFGIWDWWISFFCFVFCFILDLGLMCVFFWLMMFEMLACWVWFVWEWVNWGFMSSLIGFEKICLCFSEWIWDMFRFGKIGGFMCIWVCEGRSREKCGFICGWGWEGRWVRGVVYGFFSVREDGGRWVKGEICGFYGGMVDGGELDWFKKSFLFIGILLGFCVRWGL